MFKKYCILLSLLVFSFSSIADESVCIGTTKNGVLVNGVQLPSNGKNFTSYSQLMMIAGRTYVHSKVYDVLLNTYQNLEKSLPDKVFKYAETGFENGGKFKPHKTHQNGLSVDFMVPVLNEKNQSVHLPTHLLNKFGYNIEFDNQGRFENYKIDYQALGAHLVELHKVSKENGIGIWRVLFSPDLQKYLYATVHGEYIKKNITIPTKKSWVRHDEHYHVDFDVPCRQQ